MIEKKRLRKTNFVVSLVLNFIVLLLEIIGLIWNFTIDQFDSLKYYTEDSNILAFIVSLIFVIIGFILLKSKEPVMPKWVKYFRYISVTCLTVTFSVVLFVFPSMTTGLPALKKMMLEGPMLFHHFLCPVISLISFTLFEEELGFSVKTVFIAVIPTIFYAILSSILNIARVLDGPYPFLKVYEQSIGVSVLWFVVICGGAFLLASIILWLNSKRAK